MSLARVKNWIVGEDLNADDLNAEFNNILNNPVSLVSPVSAAWDFDGVTITLDAAAATQLVSSAAVSFNFTSGAKAGTPATTGSIANWSAQTFTDSATAGSGTATAFVAHGIQRPTLAATNATVTTTDAATFYIANAPAAGTNETITSAWALWTDDGKVRHDLTATVASAAGAVLRGLYLPAVTETVTGSTNITTATGFNLVEIGIPTLSAASALTVTDAATLYLSGAPAGAGAGPATITNAYALWTDDGGVRHDLTKTVPSIATAVLRGLYLPAVTETITGSTNSTTATGFNLIEIGQPTLSAGTALTVTNAATLYIGNAPTGAGAGPAAITNAYALWIDDGAARFDGAVTVTGVLSATSLGIIDAAGDVIYGTAADTAARLAIGTAGQVFRVNSGATAPEWGSSITLGTEQASTSGTSIDFASIPSWAKEITIMFAATSTNGTSRLLIQIGPSGTPETTGYSTAVANSAGVGVTSSAAGFILSGAPAAADTHSGSVTLALEDSANNTWVATGLIYSDNSAFISYSAGIKSAASAINTVRITTVNGSECMSPTAAIRAAIDKAMSLTDPQ